MMKKIHLPFNLTILWEVALTKKKKEKKSCNCCLSCFLFTCVKEDYFDYIE